MIDQFLPGGAARGVGPLLATVAALVVDSLLWKTIWMTMENLQGGQGSLKDGLRLGDH